MARHFHCFCVALLLSTAAYCMVIERKWMSMDEAVMKAGSQNTRMFELMQDKDNVRIEMDIDMNMTHYMHMMEPLDDGNSTTDSSRVKRKVRRSNYYRWIDNIVPYEINTCEMSCRDIYTIFSAITDYHKYTCVRFRRAGSGDSDKIRFQNGNGCSSYVGRIRGTQAVTLGNGCRTKGIIIHELGHAIGFFHEQGRPDRDDSVDINEDNVLSSKLNQFMKYTTRLINTFDVPYDYTSVMHYGQYAFAKRHWLWWLGVKLRTIDALDSNYQSLMGQRSGLSFNDIKLANLAYNCGGGCSTKCPSSGFVGQDCKCYCDNQNYNDPLRECSGLGRRRRDAHEEDEVEQMPLADCFDMDSECDFWADKGYCTVEKYEIYMTTNCQRTCNRCSNDTTTTSEPTATPESTTPANDSCVDELEYCEKWAEIGECERNPSFMMNSCKKACNVCGGYTPECRDMNNYCPSLTQYCNNDLFKDYLKMNCALSCQLCDPSSSPTTPTTPAPTGAPTESTKMCENKSSDEFCARKAKDGKCMSSLIVRAKCHKTCFVC